MSAVSSTCTSRKKKIATPVMRCSTHDHMPSSPAVQRAARDLGRGLGYRRCHACCLQTRSSSLDRTWRGGNDAPEVARHTDSSHRRHAGAASILFPPGARGGDRGSPTGPPRCGLASGGFAGAWRGDARGGRRRPHSDKASLSPPSGGVFAGARRLDAPGVTIVAIRSPNPGRMPEPIEDFYAVIPAGGIGSRLWPLSRADAPSSSTTSPARGRRFCATPGIDSSPLGPDRIAVVTGRAHRAAVERGAPGHPRQERVPRVGAARLDGGDRAGRRDPRAARARRIIGSFAADHVIRVPHLFDWAVRQAVATAREGYICTIGIQPSEAGRRLRLHPQGRRARRRRRAGGGARRQLRREARPRHREGVLREPVVPVERGHVHQPRRRAARRDRRERAASSTPD